MSSSPEETTDSHASSAPSDMFNDRAQPGPSVEPQALHTTIPMSEMQATTAETSPASPSASSTSDPRSTLVSAPSTDAPSIYLAPQQFHPEEAHERRASRLSLHPSSLAQTILLNGPVVQSPVETAASNPFHQPATTQPPPNNPSSGLVGDDLDLEVQRLLELAIHDGLYCMLPSYVEKAMYEKPAGAHEVRKRDANGRPVPPRMRSGAFNSADEIDEHLGFLPKRDPTLGGWRQHRHPNNSIYFVNHAFSGKDDAFSVVTDDFLRKGNVVEKVNSWVQRLHAIIEKQRASRTSKVRWPEKYELYVHVEIDDNGSTTCGYYLIDQQGHQVFWMHSFPEYQYIFPDMPEGATGQVVENHLTHEFWCHKQAFPYGPSVEGAEQALRNALIMCAAGMETSPAFSMSPLLEGQPMRLLSLLDRCTDSDHKNWLVARLNAVHFLTASLNGAGDYGALMDRRQPPMNDNIAKGRRSLGKLIPYGILHVLALTGDVPYMKKIREVTVGNYISPQPWQDFMKRLVDSNRQSNIISAILFTANIGFLAIQDLEELQSILSIISALLSLASLLVGLVQGRQHAGLLKTMPGSGSTYFYRAKTSWLGYRGLALTFALPNAMLSWAVITLVSALLLYAFQRVATTWLSCFLIVGIVSLVLLIMAASVRLTTGLTTDLVPVHHWKSRCMAAVWMELCITASASFYACMEQRVRRILGLEETLPLPATAAT